MPNLPCELSSPWPDPSFLTPHPTPVLGDDTRLEREIPRSEAPRSPAWELSLLFVRENGDLLSTRTGQTGDTFGRAGTGDRLASTYIR